MGYVKNDDQAEALTRAAAKAIHKDVTGWVWVFTGLVKDGYDGGLCQRFAPLNNPADAYLVEHLLMIDTKYQVGASTTMINMRDKAHGASAAATIYANEDALKIRMETAVRVAALVAAMMKDDDDE